jgi:hypothetical protein
MAIKNQKEKIDKSVNHELSIVGTIVFFGLVIILALTLLLTPSSYGW